MGGIRGARTRVAHGIPILTGGCETFLTPFPLSIKVSGGTLCTPMGGPMPMGNLYGGGNIPPRHCAPKNPGWGGGGGGTPVVVPGKPSFCMVLDDLAFTLVPDKPAFCLAPENLVLCLALDDSVSRLVLDDLMHCLAWNDPVSLGAG